MSAQGAIPSIIPQRNTTLAMNHCFSAIFPVYFAAIISDDIPNIQKARVIFLMREGLSRGIHTFIRLQRFQPVKIARKRKKKPRNPQNESIL